MKRHRIFIAINLPERVKRNLVPFQKKWPEIPAKWVKPENLHITLEFLGYLKDEELVEVCRFTKEAALKHNSFDINLIKICYGLPLSAGQALDKKPPRMIWAVGEKSEEFTALKDGLDKSLGISESREFSPHITLGRIRKWDWQRIEPEERPEINEEINLIFSVNSIEIMESVLKRGGPEYSIIESFNLR